MKMKTSAVWITLALLVVGAVAVPAMAQPDDRGRPDHAGPDGDPGAQGNRSDDARNRSADARNGSAERGAPHQAAHERFAARCAAQENETGNVSKACERARHVHDHAHQARRAAHGLLKAVDALEHRIVTLERLELKFSEKLEGENLTANETAAFEAKIERIQAMQNATLERIEAMEARLDGLKEKWEDAREHVRAARDRIVVCHVGEADEADDAEGNATGNATGNETGGNETDDAPEPAHNVTIEISRAAWAAHEAHGDSLGACAGDDESDALEEEDLEASEEESGDEEDESEEESEG